MKRSQSVPTVTETRKVQCSSATPVVRTKREGPSINYVVSLGGGGPKSPILHSKMTVKTGWGEEGKNCQF